MLRAGDASEFGGITPKRGMAYGVDSMKKEFYSLRQARYHALAFDLQQIATEYQEKGRRLKVLEIGIWDGITKKYLDVWPSARNIDLHGADIQLRDVYQKSAWAGFFLGDLMEGYQNIPSNEFDIVICEQVLEHLPELETPVRTLERVLRPGGTLFVGVPIFPFGLHLVRKYIVPKIDKMNPYAKKRGHVQAFSQRSFIDLIQKLTTLKIESIRGFRVVSGGILRPLENLRPWWQLNRWIGRRVPWICTEIQVIAHKAEPAL